MTPARWAQIKEVFNSAHEKPAKERDALLDQLCGEDVALHAEVKRLLAEEDGGSLRSPVAEILTEAAPLAAGGMVGRYRVEQELGHGGMGAVYRAFDTQLRRPVALKVLPPEHTEDPHWRRRLLNEARAASALNQPNIIAIYEVGSEAGVDFIAMEFVEGRPLDRIIPPKGLPVREALNYAVQIAEGLAKAHACGVIHRDLKPSNIMVTGDGLVKLLDFGLARRVITPDAETTLTMTREVAGTPSYMSPEQAQGKPVDTRSDVFSFGSVLFEMITGRRAFMGETVVATLAAIVNQEPPSPSAISGAGPVPQDVERVVMRCLRKDPQRRWQNMSDLKIALQDLKEESDSRKLSGLRMGRAADSAAKFRAAVEERVMLAVLPLENLSRDPEQDYFADGLTEDLITELGGLSPKRLGVIARTSAMQYKRTNKGASQIGRELAVDYIVEGAVRRDGNRVRITAQLIRVSDQTHLWAHSYERQMQDVLLLQSELASAIGTEVQVQLVPRAKSPAASRRRVNPETYETCLKARFFWNRRTREDLYRALELFSNAIEKSQDSAPAFAGLADTYLALLDYRYVAPHEALVLATAASVNAIRLDERLADAHTSLAHARMHALDWQGAEVEFRRAIQLGPGNAVARFYYANFLTGRRRFQEALAETREAVKLDPVSMLAESNIAILYYSAGRYDEALQACRKALEMEPNLARPFDDLGRILLEKGSYSEAIAALEKAVSLSNRSARCLSSLAYAYAVAGRKNLASEILAELTEKSKQQYVGSSDFAFVNAGLGQRDQAIYWLERACEERDSHLPFLHVDPRLASLRADPRFVAMLERLKLQS